MLNNRNGQARILSISEIETLFKDGLLIARDKALFALCLYTGLRISEARQIPFKNVFHNGKVLDTIVVPKEITKAKQGTRVIPTHPSLSKRLIHYYEDSLMLAELRKKFGDWTHSSLNAQGKLTINQYLLCPQCQSYGLVYSGHYKGEQCYLCKPCQHWIRESRALKNPNISEADALVEYDTFGVSASNNYAFLFLDPDNPFLFTGCGGKGGLSLTAASMVFNNAFARVGIIGASSHSCRRTALTMMHRAKVPLRVLQEISGHKDLGSLQKYLEVSEEEVVSAINLLD